MASNLADKSAIAEVGIGYFDGEDMEIFIGTINGTIAKRPRGTRRLRLGRCIHPKWLYTNKSGNDRRGLR
ncbi:hypothetical protein A2713_00365 [candidate division WWE3 bacterium RIFCSPHIGHO2_01_FULL_35_17]|uniref:Uncharacterized protein n=1 Tax=candidate division WWE3 bacterium RIFCSPHIGHO2_01_FULL_35_17 TaxID=1802614 RepID=A0A1F4URK4_UNCKA|nr:MAG: hypothetical protein A2713_00365 [candidate division WWE3 bacterium RIFCSPHIGHO2_01_FULL_35_17]